ncbi:MAG: hypothetical protein IJP25_06145 [Elusimicrobiaceae bacterium]|nr:hypothetical protein [Elusimicrobiaceae bacterium]
MKWFNLLTSKAGKIVMGSGQLMVVSAVVGIGATTLMHNTASKMAEERLAARSLSGISSQYQYDGLQQRGGMLTSINVGGGENLATAEEIAAREGYADFGASTADDAEANLAYSIGNAAQFNSTEGFGQDKDVDVSFSGTRASGASGGNGNDAGGVYTAAAPAPASAPSEAADRPQLTSASMARSNASGGTSGNVFNTASNAPGTRSGGAGTPSPTRSSGGSGYQFSGAMPSGSSAMGLGGSSSSSGSTFIAGSRNGTVGNGTRSNREKNELKDIAKRSADAASNAHRSANEGSRAFLAGSRNSGGIGVEEAGEMETASSSDFANDNKRKLKAVGDWAQKQDEKAKKQAKDRKTLTWMFLGLIAATLAVIPSAFLLISNGRRLGAFGGIAMIIAGCLLVAGVVVLASFLIDKARMYSKEYQSTFLTVASYVVSAAAYGAMLYTVIKAFTCATDGGKIALSGFFSKAAGAAKVVGVNAGTTIVTNKVTEAMSGAGEESAAKK